MHLFKSVLAGALLVAATAAETIAFTSFPEKVEVGKRVELTWTGGSKFEPTTIKLSKGPSDDLKVIETLTSSGVAGKFIWTPKASLVDGSDYALEISQGKENVNYSKQFPISGGDGEEEPTTGTGTVTQTLSLTQSATTGKPTASITSAPSAGLTSTIARNATSFTRSTMTSAVTITPTGAQPTATPSETPTGGAALVLASPFALIMGVLAAFAM
ncbi:hypothetical protein FQN50_006453 [Emmonsiellopsis sp. PD_5]|nr:hypothetical protein FQN50_006453 [Emmonsiellopsis sp. PD_5]